jgi:hypothetical protein
MKPTRKKRGQFVIIAVLLTAIMIISIGALMHSAVTYYKHEPWEEYSTLIGDIEVNSRRLLELSLASYTNTAPLDDTILSGNLEKWQNNLTEIYPSSGIVLESQLSAASSGSNPRVTADFTLDINAIGLKGYTFSATISLNIAIRSMYSSSLTEHEITTIIKSESGNPVSGLKSGNFRLNNQTVTGVVPVFDSNDVLVYKIPYNGTLPVTVDVWDQRGIHAFVST